MFDIVNARIGGKPRLRTAVGAAAFALVGGIGGLTSSVNVLAEVQPIHSKSTHEAIATKAIEKSALGAPSEYTQEIEDGSKDEDGPFLSLRPRNHAWCPISGKGFVLGGPSMVTIKERWDQMKTQFESETLTGGDDKGAWHYLGRASHLLQDITSPLHVLREWHVGVNFDEIIIGDTCNYELYYKVYPDQLQRYLNSAASPIYPNDVLPGKATNKLDPFTVTRLRTRYNSRDYTGGHDVREWLEVLGWISYFRVTVWGEVTMGSSGSSGPATSNKTTRTYFDSDKEWVDAQDNALHTMFDGNVRWVASLLDNYFEITDRKGYTYRWKNWGTTPDTWYAYDTEDKDATTGQIDGHQRVGSGDYDAGEVRTVGRFWFNTSWLGTKSARGTIEYCYPNKYPDGSAMSDDLFHCWGEYLFPLAVQYNASLLELANRRVTVKTTDSASTSGFSFNRIDNFGRGPDFSTDSSGKPFYFVAKSAVTLTAPNTNRNGWRFKRWLKNGAELTTNQSTTINTTSDWIARGGDTYTAEFEQPMCTITVQSDPSGVSISDPDGRGTTQYSRTKNCGTSYWLEALSQSPDSRPFSEWQKNGSRCSTNRRIDLTFADGDVYKAVYGPPQCTITVQSDPSGVSISDPDGGGTTQYSRTKNCGTSYWLEAPSVYIQIVDGPAPFKNWLRNGAPYSTSPRINLTVADGDIYKAIYDTKCTITIQSEPSGVRINDPDGGGTTPYTRIVQSGESYWLEAPASGPEGCPFMGWQRDRAIFSTDRRISFPASCGDVYKVVYACQCTITVQSDPSSVSISDSDGGETTQYTRTKKCGTSYWLEAPSQSPDSRPFSEWQKNGSRCSTNRRIDLTFADGDVYKAAYGMVRFEVKAFLPASWCTSVDVSPDKGTIYARAHFGNWNEGVRLYSGATYEHIKDLQSLPNVPWTILASADGKCLYATNYYGGSVVKLDSSTGQVVKSIPVGSWPNRMVFDNARRYMYVGVNCPGTGATGWISAIDTSTDTVVGKANLNGEPNHPLVLSPDEQFLYVGTHQVPPETLYKIGTSNMSVLKTLAVPGIHNPGMSISPDGNFLYMADGPAGAVRIIETASLTQTGAYSIPHVQNFSVSPSGVYALATAHTTDSLDVFVHVFDMSTGGIVQTISRTLTGSTQNIQAGDSSILWDRVAGKAYIPVLAEAGGVIVLAPGPDGGHTPEIENLICPGSWQKASLTTNLSATASSIYSAAYGPEKAIDGNQNTWWAGKPGQDSYWIELDLKSDQPLGYFEIDFFSNKYTPSTVTYRTRTAGGSYGGANPVNVGGETLVGLTKRYIKIEMNRPEGGYPAIREIRVYLYGVFWVNVEVKDAGKDWKYVYLRVFEENPGPMDPEAISDDTRKYSKKVRIPDSAEAGKEYQILVTATHLADSSSDTDSRSISIPCPEPTPSASGGPSYPGPYGPEKAFDNNPNTWWAGKPNAGPWELRYCFPGSRMIEGVEIIWFSEKYACPNTYVSVSVDGCNWGQEKKYTSGVMPINEEGQCVRIRMTGAVPGGYPAIKEVIFKGVVGHPPQVSNIRLDPVQPERATELRPVKATASSIYGPAYGPEKAIDGNMNTWWAGKPNQGSYWLELDFGSDKYLAFFGIGWYSNQYAPTTATFKTRPDGGTWSEDSPVVTWGWTVERTVRYLRLIMSQPPGDYPAIKEVKLYTGGLFWVGADVKDLDKDVKEVWVEVFGQRYPMSRGEQKDEWTYRYAGQVFLPPEASGAVPGCVKALDERGNIGSACFSFTLPTAPPPLGPSGGPSYPGPYGPDKAFDGNPNTWWAGQDKAGEWNLYYGFSTTRRLNSLSIQSFSDKYKCGDTWISTSTDGVNWSTETKYSGTSITLNRDVKWFRIRMAGTVPGGYPAIREVLISAASPIMPVYVMALDGEEVSAGTLSPEASTGSATTGSIEATESATGADVNTTGSLFAITKTEIVCTDPLKVRISWDAVPGGDYRILWTDDLTGPAAEWHEVIVPWPNLTVDGDERSWIDDGSDPSMLSITPADVRCRFYRVEFLR